MYSIVEKKYSMIENMNERVSNFNGTIYGFNKELDALYHALNRYKKSSVLLIGKAGVGKTALVEKFCQEINKGKVPKRYKNIIVYELSLNSLISNPDISLYASWSSLFVSNIVDTSLGSLFNVCAAIASIFLNDSIEVISIINITRSTS